MLRDVFEEAFVVEVVEVERGGRGAEQGVERFGPGNAAGELGSLEEDLRKGHQDRRFKVEREDARPCQEGS